MCPSSNSFPDFLSIFLWTTNANHIQILHNYSLGDKLGVAELSCLGIYEKQHMVKGQAFVNKMPWNQITWSGNGIFGKKAYAHSQELNCANIFGQWWLRRGECALAFEHSGIYKWCAINCIVFYQFFMHIAFVKFRHGLILKLQKSFFVQQIRFVFVSSHSSVITPNKP